MGAKNIDSTVPFKVNWNWAIIEYGTGSSTIINNSLSTCRALETRFSPKLFEFVTASSKNNAITAKTKTIIKTKNKF